MRTTKKIMISAMLILLILVGGGSYQLMAKRMTATQVVYHAIQNQNTSEYTVDEQAAYDDLLALKEIAFSKLDVQTLEEVQEAVVVLFEQVQNRLQSEVLQQAYDIRQERIVSIVLPSGSTDVEEEQLQRQKTQALQMIVNQDDLTAIDDYLLQIEALCLVITNAIHARNTSWPSDTIYNSSDGYRLEEDSESEGDSVADPTDFEYPGWGSGCTSWGNCWEDPNIISKPPGYSGW